MPAILTIRSVTGIEERVTIGNTAAVGRGADNDVVLSAPRSVSRQHALIRCVGGNDYQIMDLGSRNGTSVDGQPIVMPLRLHDGARIMIEGNEMVFHPLPVLFPTDAGDATIPNLNPRAADREVECEVAMLVCDIRGFSGQSERIKPALLSKVLGNWFRDAGRVVGETHGVIDKFIGDALFCYWMEQPGRENACQRGLGAAERILALAAARAWPGSHDPFRVAAALHHGKVSHGNIGVDARRDATIVGDSVNVAFRLEGVMKGLGLNLAMTAPFVDQLGDTSRFRDFGLHEIRGMSRRMRVFGPD